MLLGVSLFSFNSAGTRRQCPPGPEERAGVREVLPTLWHPARPLCTRAASTALPR
jgi:hypothetical protein